MKKILMGVVACAAVATSCQKNEVTDFNQANPNAIGFTASTGKAGKAASATVDANLKAGFVAYATTATNNAFIVNKVYDYNTSNAWGWKVASEGKTWPTVTTDYPMNFYACYPVDAFTLDASAAGYSYSVIGHDGDAGKSIGDQVDLLTAQYTGVTARPTTGTVALNFEHALSKIDFKVVAGQGTTVIIQSVKVKNVEKTGAYSYLSKLWTVGSTYTNSYSYLPLTPGAAKSIVGATNSTETIADAAILDNNNKGFAILMPQTATSNKWDPTTQTTSAQFSGKTMIEVVYRVINTADSKPLIGYTNVVAEYPGYAGLSPASTTTGAVFVKVGFLLDAVWAPGKAYTYHLFLGTSNTSGGNLIEANFIKEDGTLSDLLVKDPGGNTIEVPKPVTDQTKPIGFTVSVVDWSTTGAGDQTVN